MIIRKQNNYYSVSGVLKKNIFSESRKGNLFLHSRLIYINPILLNDCSRDNINVIKERELYVSSKGALDFRRVNVSFFKIPIEGDFIITDTGSIISLYARYYKVLASIVELSERYISKNQLNEVRENSNYDIEFEEDLFYAFIKVANCQIEQRNEFRFYSVEPLKNLKKFIENTKNRFFLKVPIDSLKKIGTFKAQCGTTVIVYRAEVPPDNMSLLEGAFHAARQGTVRNAEWGATTGIFIETMNTFDTDLKYKADYVSVKIKTSKSKTKIGGYICKNGDKNGDEELFYFAFTASIDNEKEILVEIPQEIIANHLK